MSVNLVGLLLVLFLVLISTNLILAAQNDFLFIAWLNQIIIGIILITAISFLIVRISIRRITCKEEEKK
jgi:hypothetical protein